MVGLRRRLASARSLSNPRPPTPCTDTWALPVPHDRGGAAAAASRTSPRLKLRAESAPYYAAATISATKFVAAIRQRGSSLKGMLVQWPLLRDFSDQLSRSRVEACLLLFFC